MSIGEIKSVAIIGAGTMGQGIAEVCATAGFKVLLYDIMPQSVSSAVNAIKRSLEVKIQKDKITSRQKESILDLITPTSNFEKLQVDLAIEAVTEKIDIKQKLFKELEMVNSRNCILTTNTSSIPVTQIAASLQHADRFAGLHFFNPPAVMKLVEVVKGSATDDSTIALLADFSRKLSKVPVFAQDSPGFIVNRVARHYYVESLKILEENVADVTSIDKLLRSTGFKMGPFELIDLIGVDVNLSVTTSIYNAFHQDAKFRPSRIQQQKVEAGYLGRKAGKGFYDYSGK